jgi:uncharacterized protein
MHRYLDDFLIGWAKQTNRKPLLFRGARQTGKSFAVQNLGKTFKSFVEINFERMPEYARVFEQNLDPVRIVRELASRTGKEIIAGNTLLFFDEIQICPKAITGLRYFYEEMRELHVIGAGSLLEFAFSGISFPVGRIEFVHVRPFTFNEYLAASGRGQLIDMIGSAGPSKPLSDSMHGLALELFRDYCFFGGMPGVLAKTIDQSSFDDAISEQQTIITAYRNDFLKYTTRAGLERIEAVFSAIPRIAGKKVAYSKIDPESRAFQLRNGVDQLEKANIISRVRETSGAGVPLAAGASDKRFKLVFVDTGLFQHLSGIRYNEWHDRSPLLAGYLGSVVEQTIGQELLYLDDSGAHTGLFYWSRADKRATAEIDYLVASGETIVPVEVKAGAAGHMKSLLRFLAEHHQSPVGVKFSEQNFTMNNKILAIPVYAVSRLKDIITAVI